MLGQQRQLVLMCVIHCCDFVISILNLFLIQGSAIGQIKGTSKTSYSSNRSCMFIRACFVGLSMAQAQLHFDRNASVKKVQGLFNQESTLDLVRMSLILVQE